MCCLICQINTFNQYLQLEKYDFVELISNTRTKAIFILQKGHINCYLDVFIKTV